MIHDIPTRLTAGQVADLLAIAASVAHCQLSDIYRLSESRAIADAVARDDVSQLPNVADQLRIYAGMVGPGTVEDHPELFAALHNWARRLEAIAAETGRRPAS